MAGAEAIPFEWVKDERRSGAEYRVLRVRRDRATYEVRLHDDAKQEWLRNGRVLKGDGPALLGRGEGVTILLARRGGHNVQVSFYDSGRVEWRRDGELHRAKGPALILPDGERRWFLAGVPARVVRADGRDTSPVKRDDADQQRAERDARRSAEALELWRDEAGRAQGQARHRRPKT